MNQSQGLVKAYTIDNAGGVTEYSAVVQGAEDGGCKIPTGANVGGFLGLTIEAQPNQNKGVAVQKTGIARARSLAGWTRGDWLGIGDNTGALTTVEATVIHAPGTASIQYLVGIAETSANAGDIAPVWINPGIVNIAVS
jgi:hypothetical protein